MRLTVDPIQKHIMLLKLVDAYENIPTFLGKTIRARSPEREWLSRIGAIFNILGVEYHMAHRQNMHMIDAYQKSTIKNILGRIGDAIEEKRGQICC